MIYEKIQLYEERPDVTLTAYVLSDSRELLKGQKRPAVLVCPGGGYLGCSDREAEPVALRFMAMGYHAFVLQYSTYTGETLGGPMPDSSEMAVNPLSVHPNPVRDIGKAFLTLHEHADEWLVDMDKVAICGFSAGGHNCAMYSVYWDTPLMTEHFGAEARLFKPAAAILGYALIDQHLVLGDKLDPQGRPLSDAVNIAFFGTPTPDDAVRDETSPNLLVTANTPPTFIWATTADALVPVEHSTRMATALARAGVPFEIHVFEEGKHGLSLADLSTAASQLDVEPDAAKWVGLAEKWLEKRLGVPELPALPPWTMSMQENEGN